jgi:hypothetical protein
MVASGYFYIPVAPLKANVRDNASFARAPSLKTPDASSTRIHPRRLVSRSFTYAAVSRRARARDRERESSGVSLENLFREKTDAIHVYSRARCSRGDSRGLVRVTSASLARWCHFGRHLAVRRRVKGSAMFLFASARAVSGFPSHAEFVRR